MIWKSIAVMVTSAAVAGALLGVLYTLYMEKLESRRNLGGEISYGPYVPRYIPARYWDPSDPDSPARTYPQPVSAPVDPDMQPDGDLSHTRYWLGLVDTCILQDDSQRAFEIIHGIRDPKEQAFTIRHAIRSIRLHTAQEFERLERALPQIPPGTVTREEFERAAAAREKELKKLEFEFRKKNQHYVELAATAIESLPDIPGKVEALVSLADYQAAFELSHDAQTSRDRAAELVATIQVEEATWAFYDRWMAVPIGAVVTALLAGCAAAGGGLVRYYLLKAVVNTIGDQNLAEQLGVTLQQVGEKSGLWLPPGSRDG